MTTLNKLYYHNDLHVLQFKSMFKTCFIYFIREGFTFSQYNVKDCELVYTAGSYHTLIYNVDHFLNSDRKLAKLEKLDNQTFIVK